MKFEYDGFDLPEPRDREYFEAEATRQQAFVMNGLRIIEFGQTYMFRDAETNTLQAREDVEITPDVAEELSGVFGEVIGDLGRIKEMEAATAFSEQELRDMATIVSSQLTSA